MNYLQAIHEFDGKHVGDLKAHCDRHPAEPHVIDDLIAICDSGEALPQIAASWMLKSYWEQGYSFSQQQSRQLLQRLDSLNRWEAVLHVLQMLDGVDVESRQANRVWKTCRRLQEHENKMVRAWALNGLSRVATLHPKYAAEAIQQLAVGMSDTSAAVRARARKLHKFLETKTNVTR